MQSTYAPASSPKCRTQLLSLVTQEVKCTLIRCEECFKLGPERMYNVRSNPQMFKGKIMFACDLFLINAHSTCNLARWQRKKFQVFRVAKRGGEMIPTLAVDWRSWRVHRHCGWSATDTFNCRQLSGFNK